MEGSIEILFITFKMLLYHLIDLKWLLSQAWNTFIPEKETICKPFSFSYFKHSASTDISFLFPFAFQTPTVMV